MELEKIIRKNWHFIFLLILVILALIFLVKPFVATGNYSLLQTWDSWNHYVFAKAIFDNGGLIPDWYYLELFPMGRPFLYPPLVPALFAWISILTAVNLFTVVKITLYLAYFIFFIAFLWLLKEYKDKKLTLLSSILLLSVTQLFITSINNFAQILEMAFFVGIILSLYKKKFLPAVILFGLSFYTHFFTPFLMALFLVFLIIFDRKNLKLYLKTLVGGLLIASFWLYRFLFHFDWIQPNLMMEEHTNLLVWFWRFGVEGFSFFILLLFLIFFFILNKGLFKKFFSKKLNKMLLLYTIAFLPGFFYPERAITYICFPIVIFCAQIFIKYFKKSLLPLILSVLIPVILLRIVIGNPAGLIFFHVPGSLIFILAIASLITITFVLLQFNFREKLFSRVFFALFVLILFFNPAVYGVILPINSTIETLDVTIQLPEEVADACEWIKQSSPEAIVISQDNRVSALCISYGLKTTNYMVMEFAKKANNYPHKKYATHFIGYKDLNEPDLLLWNEGMVYVYDYTK